MKAARAGILRQLERSVFGSTALWHCLALFKTRGAPSDPKCPRPPGRFPLRTGLYNRMWLPKQHRTVQHRRQARIRRCGGPARRQLLRRGAPHKQSAVSPRENRLRGRLGAMAWLPHSGTAYPLPKTMPIVSPEESSLLENQARSDGSGATRPTVGTLCVALAPVGRRPGRPSVRRIAVCPACPCTA